MRAVKKLFDNSMHGVSFYGKTRSEVIKRMKKIRTLTGIERLNHFLSILDILSISTDYKLLAKQKRLGQNFKGSMRMNRIYEYIMNNFLQKITVKEVATQVNMCEGAFSVILKRKPEKHSYHF